MKLEIAHESVVLTPGRAICWPARHTQFIADAHFGKAASFRAHAVPVPESTTTRTLTALDTLRARHEVRRIVFLGEFLRWLQFRLSACRTCANSSSSILLLLSESGSCVWMAMSTYPAATVETRRR